MTINDDLVKHDWITGYGKFECTCHGIKISDGEIVEFRERSPNISLYWALNMIAAKRGEQPRQAGAEEQT